VTELPAKPETETRGERPVVADRERELRALVAPIAEELELSTRELNTELDCESPAVRDVSAHARMVRGKRLRAAVALLVAKALQRQNGARLAEPHIKIAAIVEMIHMATLVHDDVLDRAETRRRMPTVNAKFGNQVAVLLGDWIYARAFCISTRLADQTCSRVLSEVTATICRGEIEQSRAKYDFGLTRDRYIAMIFAKTASLYEASCDLGAWYAGASAECCEAAREFGRSLGLAFQIVDDCLDFDGAEAVVGKSLGTDVVEGKITLPIIHLLRRHDAAGHARVAELFHQVREAGGAPAAAHRAMTQLRAEFDLESAVAESYAEAQRYAAAAREALKPFPRSEARECLDRMAEYVLDRRW
jgi:octaprenyl-diphosphate synthase